MTSLDKRSMSEQAGLDILKFCDKTRAKLIAEIRTLNLTVEDRVVAISKVKQMSYNELKSRAS